MRPRDLSEADYDWVLALSARHEVETGKLDQAKLASMHRAAYWAAACGDKAGYLLTFDQDSPYDSPNFVWFKARYPRFVYIDRIVVEPTMRKQGVGRAFYEALFDRARRDGYSVAACEVNFEPPNPLSDLFHARLAFQEVGRAKLANGKGVRYLLRRL